MPFYQAGENSEKMTVGGGEVTATLVYHAYPYALVVDVYEAAVSGTPTGYGGASRLSIEPDLLAGELWQVSVRYGTPTGKNPALDENTTPPTLLSPPPSADPSNTAPVSADQPAPLPALEGQLGGPPGDASFNPPGGGDGGDGTAGGLPDPITRDQALGGEVTLTIGSGTQKIYTSKAVTYSRAPGFDVVGPDTGLVIGATAKEAEGVEIIVPKETLRISRTIRKVTMGYVDAVSALVGCVNNASFLTFAEGELLLSSVTLAWKSPGGWTGDFEFAVQKNRTNVVVIPAQPDAPGATAAVRGGLILPKVEGWQYVDVRMKPKEVSFTNAESVTEKVITQVPAHAVVHTVYDKKDFTALGFQ